MFLAQDYQFIYVNSKLFFLIIKITVESYFMH